MFRHLTGYQTERNPQNQSNCDCNKVVSIYQILEIRLVEFESYILFKFRKVHTTSIITINRASWCSRAVRDLSESVVSYVKTRILLNTWHSG